MTSPEARVSIAALEDREPYAAYDALLSRGEAVYDDDVGAWIVPDYDGCREVLGDAGTYGKLESLEELDEWTLRVHGSARKLAFLTEHQHARLHKWWLEVFSRRAVDTWRPSVIRPIVDLMIDRFAADGEAELWDQFAKQIPIRVVAAITGLDWQSDAAMATMAQVLDVHADYFNHRPNPSPELAAAAERALADFAALTDDVIASRADNHPDRDAGKDGEDVVRRLWRIGREMFADWTAADVRANLHNILLAGTDSTAFGIANAVHRLLVDDQLREQVASDPAALVGFVEEALRLDPPAQYRARSALRAVAEPGRVFAQGETILPVLAAANRDPRKFECPAQVRVERRVNHLSFGIGPRRCVGAFLARAEIQEAVAALVTRLPDARLIGAAPTPLFCGRMLRVYRPLHVAFAPAAPRPR